MIVSIDMWSKYYFLTWNNENNQYYYDGGYPTSRAKIINTAIKLASKIANLRRFNEPF